MSESTMAGTAAPPARPTYAEKLCAPASAPRRNSTTGPTPAPASPSRPTGSRKLPPIMVESLPSWPLHLEEMRRRLGRAPAARPLGAGIRLLPKTEEEHRVITSYLTELEGTVPGLSWYSYSMKSDKPLKVALRGLPTATDTRYVLQALQERGYPAIYARNIPPRLGRVSSVIFVELSQMPRALLTKLYETTELLNMQHVTVEAWRSPTSAPQCHRCQAFGHASALCHRPQRCVKCGGPHHGRECSPDAPKKCSNCAGPHAANNRSCPWFRREARKRAIPIPGDWRSPAQPAPTPQQTPPKQQWSIIQPEQMLQRSTPRLRLELPSPAPVSRADRSSESTPPPTTRTEPRRQRRGRRGRGTPSPPTSPSYTPPGTPPAAVRPPARPRSPVNAEPPPIPLPRRRMEGRTTTLQAEPESEPQHAPNTEPQGQCYDSVTEAKARRFDMLLQLHVGLLKRIVEGVDVKPFAAIGLDKLRALAEPNAANSLAPQVLIYPDIDSLLCARLNVGNCLNCKELGFL